MVMGRILIMGSGSSIWVLNYSATYTMYAILLAQEMINTYLPNLSKRQASRMVFAGESVNDITSLDVAGTAVFCLGSLTFVFCAVLIVAALGSAKSALPTPFLDILGHDSIYSFDSFLIYITFRHERHMANLCIWSFSNTFFSELWLIMGHYTSVLPATPWTIARLGSRWLCVQKRD
jgi:hypothetical protein